MHQTITRGPAHEAAPSAEPTTAQSVRTEVAPPAAADPTTAQPTTAQPTAGAAGRGYPESAGSMASVAVLFGLAGLFVFNVVFGPLAIGVGVATYRRRSATGRNRGIALAGVTLGVLDLIVLAVFAVVSLAWGGFTWHFGA
jgi:hypothetical protein